MTVTVTRVRIPAMSTVGILEGTDDDGNIVTFATDHRPARNIGLDMRAGEVVRCEPEPWMILSVRDPKDTAYTERGI